MKIAFTCDMGGRDRRGRRKIFKAGVVFDAEIKRIRGDYQGVVDVLIGNYMLLTVGMPYIEVKSEETHFAQYVPSMHDRQRWIPADREESIWDGFSERG